VMNLMPGTGEVLKQLLEASTLHKIYTQLGERGEGCDDKKSKMQ